MYTNEYYFITISFYSTWVNICNLVFVVDVYPSKLKLYPFYIFLEYVLFVREKKRLYPCICHREQYTIVQYNNNQQKYTYITHENFKGMMLSKK